MTQYISLIFIIPLKVGKMFLVPLPLHPFLITLLNSENYDFCFKDEIFFKWQLTRCHQTLVLINSAAKLNEWALCWHIKREAVCWCRQCSVSRYVLQTCHGLILGGLSGKITAGSLGLCWRERRKRSFLMNTLKHLPKRRGSTLGNFWMKLLQ